MTTMTKKEMARTYTMVRRRSELVERLEHSMAGFLQVWTLAVAGVFIARATSHVEWVAVAIAAGVHTLIYALLVVVNGYRYHLNDRMRRLDKAYAEG